MTGLRNGSYLEPEEVAMSLLQNPSTPINRPDIPYNRFIPDIYCAEDCGKKGKIVLGRLVTDATATNESLETAETTAAIIVDELPFAKRALGNVIEKITGRPQPPRSSVTVLFV
jgi:hypothetical protein